MRPRGSSTHARAASAVVLIALAGGPSDAQSPLFPAPPLASSAVDPVTLHVTEAAQRFGLPASWIWAVMRVESRGDARAVSPAGALGLMQIMPQTWDYLRVRYGLGANPFDVHDNIIGGAAFLREMYDRFGSPGFLGAYNAGPARYQDHLASGRPLPAETRSYVAKLAPMVSGSPSIRAPSNPSDPLAWTRASLFVNPAQDDRPASKLPSDSLFAPSPPQSAQP